MQERAKEEILHLRKRHFCGAQSISYKQPLLIVKGQGQYLIDETGRKYLDCVNNVCHVGHCHPRVVEAANKQLAILNTNTRYLHPNIVHLAQQLTATMPKELEVCFFVNSGSEANDLALRLARCHTKAQDVISVGWGYHGATTACIEISPYKLNGRGGFKPPDYCHQVPVPDTFRGEFRRDDAEAGLKYARQVTEKIQEIRSRGRHLAAFIAESVMSCAGQIEFPPGYLSKSFEEVRQAGGVCIADEVQVGFGRAGTHFWGFQTQGVVPDIVTLGKPFGNGFPLGGVVTTRAIADSFAATGMEYFSTFGGNPVAGAVGLAVLDVIRDEKLQQNALLVGNYLKERLQELSIKHEIIGDVRGPGLFLGVELVRNRKTLEPAEEETGRIVERMKDKGVLVGTDGPYHNVLKIKPPIVFSKEDADFFAQQLDEAIQYTVALNTTAKL